MSTTIIYAEFAPGGVLTDATTAKLSDATGTYGVKRNDTSAVVVADGTDMTRAGTGVYSYSLTDPAADLIYTVAVEFMYGGLPYRGTWTIPGGTSATYPVTLDELKAQCRVTGTDEDDFLTACLATATEYAENFQNRTFITRSRTHKFDAFCDSIISLPYPPLVSVTSIAYVDSAGATQTLATSVYGVDEWSEPGRVYLKSGQSWPSVYDQPLAVTVTYQAGYGAAADVPWRVKAAIKGYAATLHEHREDLITGTIVSPLKWVDDLLWQSRVVPV